MSEFAPVVVEGDPPARRPGPGGRLQAARLERQLEVDAVAAALHVASRLVAAMEADQFEAFDAPVYARGFLRTYARFLNLPVDEVLAAYDDVVGSPALPSLIPPASARPLPRDFAVVKKGGLLVLALLMVVASYWWWMGRVAPRDSAVPSGAATQPVASEPAAVTDGDAGADVALPASESVTLGGTPDVGPASAPASAPKPAVVAPATSTAAKSPTSTPISAPPGASHSPTTTVAPVAGAASGAKPVASPTPAAPQGTLPAGRSPTALASPATAAKPAPLAGQPPPPLLAPVVDGPQIVLRGKKDCWVEVRAAGGARLFYGLVRPGETHTMPGPAPWFVFLGYADGIELSVGGHVVDVPAARRDGAKARFGLTADGTLR